MYNSKIHIFSRNIQRLLNILCGTLPNGFGGALVAPSIRNHGRPLKFLRCCLLQKDRVSWLREQVEYPIAEMQFETADSC